MTNRQPATSRSTYTLTIQQVTHEVFVDGQPLKLQNMEYDLLLLLSQHQDRILGHREINEVVWHSQFGATDNTIAAHTSHLRRKLMAVMPDHTMPIITRRYHGYQLDSKFIRVELLDSGILPLAVIASKDVKFVEVITCPHCHTQIGLKPPTPRAPHVRRRSDA